MFNDRVTESIHDISYAVEQRKKRIKNIIGLYPDYAYLKETGGVPKPLSSEEADISQKAVLVDMVDLTTPSPSPAVHRAKTSSHQPQSQQFVRPDDNESVLTETTLDVNIEHVPLQRRRFRQRQLNVNINTNTTNIQLREDMSQSEDDTMTID